MKSPVLAALPRTAALLVVTVALLGALASVALAQPRLAAVPAAEPAATFDEAARLFRAGRTAAAYGRFVRLANEGDAEAARIALVMHRHGGVLFGSAWDASTEELIEWSRLAARAERADIESRRPGASAVLAAANGPGEAQVLAPETFRSGRRARR